MQYLGANLKNDRMNSVYFQGKPFNITVMQVYAPITNAEVAEAEWFYEDLQDLLELTHTHTHTQKKKKKNQKIYFSLKGTGMQK